MQSFWAPHAKIEKSVSAGVIDPDYHKDMGHSYMSKTGTRMSRNRGVTGETPGASTSGDSDEWPTEKATAQKYTVTRGSDLSQISLGYPMGQTAWTSRSSAEGESQADWVIVKEDDEYQLRLCCAIACLMKSTAIKGCSFTSVYYQKW